MAVSTKNKFLRVIIPTYNGGEWLPRMVETIRNQSIDDYHLIIVDDQSTDKKSSKIAESLKPDLLITMDRKGYAAGARNEGMKYFTGDKYTIWLDDDDILIDEDAFKKIKECAKANNYPDIIRFNFRKTALSTGKRGNHHDRYPDPITPADICNEVQWGMPWTKAVKTDKCVNFPEELAVDDCYQHILQCDICETAAVVHDDLYEWLVREDSTTTSEINVRRDSGFFLEIAMLMRNRENMRHEWAKTAVDARIRWIIKHYIERLIRCL
jgi:glycosyltransferase involved in cell wall biosynthesis